MSKLAESLLKVLSGDNSENVSKAIIGTGNGGKMVNYYDPDIISTIFAEDAILSNVQQDVTDALIFNHTTTAAAASQFKVVVPGTKHTASLTLPTYAWTLKWMDATFPISDELEDINGLPGVAQKLENDMNTLLRNEVLNVAATGTSSEAITPSWHALATADSYVTSVVSPYTSSIQTFTTMSDALPDVFANDESFVFLVSRKMAKNYKAELRANATASLADGFGYMKGGYPEFDGKK